MNMCLKSKSSRSSSVAAVGVVKYMATSSPPDKNVAASNHFLASTLLRKTAMLFFLSLTVLISGTSPHLSYFKTSRLGDGDSLSWINFIMGYFCVYNRDHGKHVVKEERTDSLSDPDKLQVGENRWINLFRPEGNHVTSRNGQHDRTALSGESHSHDIPRFKLDSSSSATMPSTDDSLHGSLVEHLNFSLHTPMYPLRLSTEEIHGTDKLEFHGPFAHIRSKLDYKYHSNYKRDRQFLQDQIIHSMMDTSLVTDVNTGALCSVPTRPWIVFTAGAMGAGKSHTIRSLMHKKRFPLDTFVSVDQDEIRRHLPEFASFVNENAETAGILTRKEAGYIAEILTLASMRAGKNVLVDGSLRNSDWYQNYFQQLRMDYLNLRIAILHVIAPREAVFQRAAERSLITGRVVPQETLEMALEQVPKSIKVLGPMSDFFCELNNAPGAPDIELLTEGEDWESFRTQWSQTCVDQL